jgi:4-hydroxy-4-methyl-2-oxoglutarate aldolase
MTATASSIGPQLRGAEYGTNPGATGATGPGEIITDFERPPGDVVARLARLPIANVSDAMNKHGVLHPELRPVQAGTRACGPALTCGTVDLVVKVFALSLASPGDVFVLAAGGVQDYACFGEMASTVLAERGAAGAIVDGAVRDIVGIRQVGLPVFARAVTPRNYHYPFGLPYGSVNLPVVCAGMVVNPGDVIIAGDDGVIVVPRQIAAEVATAAEEIESHEATYRAAIHSGQFSSAAYEEQLRDAGYTIR